MIKRIPYLLLIPLSLLAQERPMPPTAITLPSDSSAAWQESQKIAPANDQLELPEVLIVGRDRSQRLGQEKIASTPETPRLLAAQHQPISMWMRRDNRRQTFAGLEPRLYNFWGGLSGGSYSSLAADAGYRQLFSTTSFRAAGWLRQSRGAYENSELAGGGLELHTAWLLRPELNLEAGLSYAEDRIGLYGAVLPSMERSSHALSANFRSIWQMDRDNEAECEIILQNFQARTDSGTSEWAESRIPNMQLRGSWKRTWQELLLRGEAAYQRESLSTGSIGLAGLFVEAVTPLHSQLLLIFQAGLQNFDSDSVSQGRFSPSAQLHYLPNDRLGLTLRMGSGLRYQSYYQSATFNPYIAHSHPARPDDETFALSLQGEIRIAPGWIMGASVYRGWEKTHIFWQRQLATGFMKQNWQKDVDLLEWRFMTGYQIGTRLALNAEATVLSDQVPANNHLDRADHLPYRPDYRLTARVRYELLAGLHITAESDWTGPRRTALTSKEELPAFVVMNLSAGKTMAQFGELLITFNNIFDQRYERWQGYRDPGFVIWTGLRIRL